MRTIHVAKMEHDARYIRTRREPPSAFCFAFVRTYRKKNGVALLCDTHSPPCVCVLLIAVGERPAYHGGA